MKSNIITIEVGGKPIPFDLNYTKKWIKEGEKKFREKQEARRAERLKEKQ